MEKNYNNYDIPIKSEPKVFDISSGSFENSSESHLIDHFVDISQIKKENSFYVLKDCSVVLERCDIKPEVNLKVEDPEQEDSDFEWPINDDALDWHAPNSSYQPPTSPKIEIDVKEDEDAPKKGGWGKTPVQNPKYVQMLPNDLMTDRILRSANDFETIDGIKYKIPRNCSVENQQVEIPDSQRFKRRPHRVYDLEGEKRISESVEVKCHVCGEQMENFTNVRKHFKMFHPEEKGYLKCW